MGKKRNPPLKKRKSKPIPRGMWIGQAHLYEPSKKTEQLKDFQ
jgi:hypothetical protein